MRKVWHVSATQSDCRAPRRSFWWTLAFYYHSLHRSSGGGIPERSKHTTCLLNFCVSVASSASCMPACFRHPFLCSPTPFPSARCLSLTHFLVDDSCLDNQSACQPKFPSGSHSGLYSPSSRCRSIQWAGCAVASIKRCSLTLLFRRLGSPTPSCIEHHYNQKSGYCKCSVIIRSKQKWVKMCFTGSVERF